MCNKINKPQINCNLEQTPAPANGKKEIQAKANLLALYFRLSLGFSFPFFINMPSSSSSLSVDVVEIISRTISKRPSYKCGDWTQRILKDAIVATTRKCRKFKQIRRLFIETFWDFLRATRGPFVADFLSADCWTRKTVGSLFQFVHFAFQLSADKLCKFHTVCFASSHLVNWFGECRPKSILKSVSRTTKLKFSNHGNFD